MEAKPLDANIGLQIRGVSGRPARRRRPPMTLEQAAPWPLGEPLSGASVGRSRAQVVGAQIEAQDLSGRKLLQRLTKAVNAHAEWANAVEIQWHRRDQIQPVNGQAARLHHPHGFDRHPRAERVAGHDAALAWKPAADLVGQLTGEVGHGRPSAAVSLRPQADATQPIHGSLAAEPRRQRLGEEVGNGHDEWLSWPEGWIGNRCS